LGGGLTGAITRTSTSRRPSRSIASPALIESSAGSDVAVESLVALEYPNGRTHDTTIVGETPLRPGQEFDLHGRRWRVAQPAKTWPQVGDPERMLCRPVARTADRASKPFA